PARSSSPSASVRQYSIFHTSSVFQSMNSFCSAPAANRTSTELVNSNISVISCTSSLPSTVTKRQRGPNSCPASGPSSILTPGATDGLIASSPSTRTSKTNSHGVGLVNTSLISPHLSVATAVTSGYPCSNAGSACA